MSEHTLFSLSIDELRHVAIHDPNPLIRKVFWKFLEKLTPSV